MIKLPKDFIAADYKFDFVIPIAKLETVKTSEGFEFRAVYEDNEVQEFIQHATHEMNEKVEAAIMDELLRLNGYVPELTCQMVSKSGGVYCSNCNERMDDYTCDWFFNEAMEYSYPYCYNCGAKVVK